jgi:hypothetical protein
VLPPDVTNSVVMDACGKIEKYGNEILSKAKLLPDQINKEG